MKALFLTIVCVLGFINAGQAQEVVSGTVIVYELTNNEFAIAADSRESSRAGGPVGDRCKITAFKAHRAVFAATGGSVLLNKDGSIWWDAWSEAKRDLGIPIPPGPNGFQKYLDLVTQAWIDTAKANWMLLSLNRPDTFAKYAHSQNGLLVTGIFAVAHDGQISLGVRGITFRNGQFGVDVPNADGCIGQPCASGIDAVFIKYARSNRPYMNASPAKLKARGEAAARVERLVDLTLKEDKSGYVHGPIDVLTMDNTGNVHWYQKKEQCPASSD